MTKYAENTSVPVERSKTEIERVLGRYGADSFGYMTEGNQAVIIFVAHSKKIRFILPLPDPNDDQFGKSPTGRSRKSTAASEAYHQEVRRRWRALSLAIKAKLESVQTGIAAFEHEFLAHIVLPNGQTVGEMVLPAIEEAYKTGKVQLLLGGW